METIDCGTLQSICPDNCFSTNPQTVQALPPGAFTLPANKQASNFLEFWNNTLQNDKEYNQKFTISTSLGKVIVHPKTFSKPTSSSTPTPVIQDDSVTSSPPINKKIKLVDYQSTTEQSLLETLLEKPTETPAPVVMAAPQNQRVTTRNRQRKTPHTESDSGKSSPVTVEDSDNLNGNMAQQIIQSINKLETKMSDKMDTMSSEVASILQSRTTGVIPRLDAITLEMKDSVIPRLNKVETTLTAKKKGLNARVQVMENLMKENADPELAHKWFISKDVPAPALTVDNLDDVYDYINTEIAKVLTKCEALEAQHREDCALLEAVISWAEVLYQANETNISQLVTLQARVYQNDLEMVGVREVPKESPLQSARNFSKTL